MSKTTDKKYKQLFLGLLFDAIGMLSFAIPFVGEFSDVIRAPLSGWLMTGMYKGKIGQAAGVVTFIEEIIPGLDVIPTFTIMWFYTYVFKSAKKQKTIEV
ncbi:hypothetical protein NYZ99_08775 [Maribacter litopenaei]|uniref:Uncharacterized protein n=1 Tax=Maribacter litopenaei TaxID=2976127 RepID=A0ABY5YDL7_9FLAO|nr:hypothetical protein [Maribacter litopenaei]UWX56294.1 hypothetical protein NYZ99_08775 [Maribacter litopenaei]